MTDRHSGYVVTLKDDVREDDAEFVINALKMIKGVISVQPVEGTATAGFIAARRRDIAWRDALTELIIHPPEGSA